MARYRRVPDGGLPQKSQLNAVYGGIEAASRDRGVDLPPSCFPALLSGPSSPYGFAEAVGAPGGGWTALAGGRSGVAYEYNGAAALGGLVTPEVCLHPDGTYRFQFRRRGAPCDARLHVTVSGCPVSGVPGVTVTATKSAFSASAVTDASGVAEIDLSGPGGGAGTYTLTVTGGGPRWQDYSGTIPVVGCFLNYRLIAMEPAPGWVCCPNPGYNCPPVPAGLFLSDADGTFAFDSVTTRFGTWRCCHDHTGAGYAFDGYGNCVLGTATFKIGYMLLCPGSSFLDVNHNISTVPMDKFGLAKFSGAIGTCSPPDCTHLFDIGGDGHNLYGTGVDLADRPACGAPLDLTFAFFGVTVTE